MRIKSGAWTPREGHKDLAEEVTLKEALIKSYNRPLIRLGEEMGWDELEAYLEGYIPKIKKPLQEYPAQLLGAVELSMSELFGVYQKFIQENCLSEDGESDVIEALSDPTTTTISHRVGRELAGQKFFGKTGTSNNGMDNWFISFDGRELGVIWFGNEGKKEADIRLFGSNTAFRIFEQFNRSRGKRFNVLNCASIENDEALTNSWDHRGP